MILRGINFGTVHGASGVQGFFGEGYWFHKMWKSLGLLRFDGMTFVAKTTTLHAREGNMPLGKRLTPQELFPKCVVVKFWKGVVLNSVGLSGPGAHVLLNMEYWQQRREPFFISFMSVASTPRERLEELCGFVNILKEHLSRFRAPVGLQLNFSCPNTGLHTEELLGEVNDGLGAVAQLGIPIVPKFNIRLPIETAQKIAEHPSCDALCVSNTIPWGQFPDRIDWEGLFGSNESPIAHIGGGGLSGKPLLPLVSEWVYQARKAGITKPISAGGGILSQKDVRVIMRAGADSIFLGSIAILRPWRVRGIVSHFSDSP